MSEWATDEIERLTAERDLARKQLAEVRQETSNALAAIGYWNNRFAEEYERARELAEALEHSLGHPGKRVGNGSGDGTCICTTCERARAVLAKVRK